MPDSLNSSAGNGRYRLEEKLGSGERGEVFRAWDNEENRWIVFKRFISPADSPTRLPHWTHPHLIHYYEAGRDDLGAFVTSEWVEGITLKEAVDFQKIDANDFIRLMRQLLEGIAAAHESEFIHGDLKPENMILQIENGKFTNAKIIDFELSNRSAEAAAKMRGSIFTMAPELFHQQPPTKQSDLYALGCTFYYLWTGKFPFTGKTDAEVMLSHQHHQMEEIANVKQIIPKEIARLISNLLSPDSEARPSAIEALVFL